MISWPAKNACHADDEHSSIAFDAEWNCHTERPAIGYGVDDMMMDGAGRVYRMDYIEDGKVQPLATGQCILV